MFGVKEVLDEAGLFVLLGKISGFFMVEAFDRLADSFGEGYAFYPLGTPLGGNFGGGDTPDFLGVVFKEEEV